jgi:hypothetical protein
MAAPTAERRQHARVTAHAPHFVRGITRSEGLRGGIEGTLLNASRGGVAFATTQPVRSGDLVELTVRPPAGEPCLHGMYARVVGTAAHPEYDLVVRCEFVEPTASEEWLSGLELAA